LNIGHIPTSRNQRQRIDFGSQELGIERADFFVQVSEMFERTVTKEEDLTRVEADMVLGAMKTSRFIRRTCCGRPIKAK
jgi:hypothetical protein